MDTVNNLTNKVTGWIDQLFSFFGVYTTKYSKYIMYGVLILLASKMMKFKFDIKTGRKG